MSGEDVYDVAVPLWCDICNAAHRSCEDPDDFDLRTAPDDDAPDYEAELLEHRIKGPGPWWM